MTYDPADNSARCYALGLALMREKRIRSGEYTPRLDDPDETRWSREGPVPDDQLESRMGL